ncbi:polyprenal reductase [Chanos chanos]|uniref:Polyprenal reductase n=1 Tax=Chanos chanos TaxID=29144 RepID=A0A6J2VA18_CHACN|nr:polyprenol reductase [Chanos chanos]
MMLPTVKPVDIIWLLLAVAFLFARCFQSFSARIPHKINQVFQDLIRYGKTRQCKRPHWLCIFDVPKRWFWHFYAVSSIWNGLLIILSLRVVLMNKPYPQYLSHVLEFLTGEPTEAWNDLKLSVLLLHVLLWVHTLRRLAECLFVSVFSDGVINVVQYTFGLSYYIFLGLTVLCVNVSQSRNGISGAPLLSQLRWYHGAGTLLYFWASLFQHRCLSLLANLRTGSSGMVETLAHRMPCGDWFELVSCPHYFAELLIYGSLGLCSGGSSLTWWLVVLYVLFNQALAAQLCHEYYKSKFDSYPQQRKAFIPYLL